MSVDQNKITAAILPVDIYNGLNQARGSMVTLVSLFITGVGIILAVWASLDDISTWRGIMVLAVPFMAINYMGFRSNLLFQNSHFLYLDKWLSSDDPARQLLAAIRPFTLRRFTPYYILLCSFITVFGFVFAADGLAVFNIADIFAFFTEHTQIEA